MRTQRACGGPVPREGSRRRKGSCDPGRAFARSCSLSSSLRRVEAAGQRPRPVACNSLRSCRTRCVEPCSFPLMRPAGHAVNIAACFRGAAKTRKIIILRRFCRSLRCNAKLEAPLRGDGRGAGHSYAPDIFRRRLTALCDGDFALIAHIRCRIDHIGLRVSARSDSPPSSRADPASAGAARGRRGDG